jgi:type 1 fimbriae regulatory protein FimB/type 1 fimbriae regulatory protein FimE
MDGSVASIAGSSLIAPVSPFVFTSERGGSPFTTAGFARMVEGAGEAADLGFKAYLGHKNISTTVRYTGLSPDRFKNFWR